MLEVTTCAEDHSETEELRADGKTKADKTVLNHGLADTLEPQFRL